MRGCDLHINETQPPGVSGKNNQWAEFPLTSKVTENCTTRKWGDTAGTSARVCDEWSHGGLSADDQNALPWFPELRQRRYERVESVSGCSYGWVSARQVERVWQAEDWKGIWAVLRCASSCMWKPRAQVEHYQRDRNTVSRLSFSSDRSC